MLYISVGDFQTSKGQILVFDKTNPGVDKLKMGDIIATRGGTWKLLDWTVATFYIKTDDKDRYTAFYVKRL